MADEGKQEGNDLSEQASLSASENAIHGECTPTALRSRQPMRHVLTLAPIVTNTKQPIPVRKSEVSSANHSILTLDCQDLLEIVRFNHKRNIAVFGSGIEPASQGAGVVVDLVTRGSAVSCIAPAGYTGNLDSLGVQGKGPESFALMPA